MDEPQYLAVSSKLEEEFTVMFHGEEFYFPPCREGEEPEAVNMPIDAVRHCFGFGQEDKTRAFHRLGWLTLVTDEKFAKAKLRKISFKPVRQVFELASARRKASDARSPVNEGGNAEGASASSADSSDGEPLKFGAGATEKK